MNKRIRFGISTGRPGWLRQLTRHSHGMSIFLRAGSGPMHRMAASEVGVSAFVFRVRPGIWFSIDGCRRILYRELECSNCNLEVCVEKRRQCLASITVDEMLQAILSVWPA
jgi:hypothetical protein